MVTTEKNLIYAYTEHARIRGVGVGWGAPKNNCAWWGGGGGARPIFSGGGGFKKKLSYFSKPVIHANTCKRDTVSCTKNFKFLN